MGCGQSKEDAEGAVARCRERKNLLRAAVEARHALSGAHAGHAAALRNVGAALTDYASGEAHEGALRHSASAAAVMSSSGGAGAQAAALALPPPPPPPGPPDDAPALVRSMSAPDLPLQPAIKKKPSGEAPIIEEEDDDEAEGEDPRRPDEEAPLQPPPPPPPLPPTQVPAPTRSPPSLPPDTGHKVQEQRRPEPTTTSRASVAAGVHEVEQERPPPCSTSRRLRPSRPWPAASARPRPLCVRAPRARGRCSASRPSVSTPELARAASASAGSAPSSPVPPHLDLDRAPPSRRRAGASAGTGRGAGRWPGGWRREVAGREQGEGGSGELSRAGSGWSGDGERSMADAHGYG